jgi:predicted TIM-barrel fold metal-dependent hydrolase
MDNFDNVLVIDADGHVSEGNIDFASRLPEKWRSQAPVKVKDNLGYTRNLIEGRVWSPSQGPAPGVTGPFTEKARKSRPGMTDPVARLKDMDLEGIDVAILFGTPIALTVNGLMSGEFAAALCRVVNEWLLEYCSADPRRLRAVGLIPCQAPEIAVEELEFLAKAGAISAMLPTNVYGRNMGDPMFFPIYEAAEKIGMTLSVHPQTGHEGIPGVSGVMAAGSPRFFKYPYVHMTAFPFELMIAIGYSDQFGHCFRSNSAGGRSERSDAGIFVLT